MLTIPRRRMAGLVRVVRGQLVCAGFALFAIHLTRGLWPDPDTRMLALNHEDQILFEWFLAHATMIWSGGFSLVTDRLNAPDGVNLLANTSVLALGAIFAPVTFSFGAPTTFAVLVAFNLAATAIAWYALFLRELGASRPAAGVGAAFCGFAPGMISQSNGHLHVTAQFLIPPLLWCIAELSRATRVEPLPVRRLAIAGALLALLAAVQVFIGEEVFFLTALTLGLVILPYVGLTRPSGRSLVVFATALSAAVGIAACLVAYPLWIQFAGPQSVSDGAFSPSTFSTDLASFPAFSPLSIAGDESGAALSTGAAEYNAFLGWPLLLLIAGIAFWLRSDARVLSSTVAMVVMNALSLGPEIVVDQRRTSISGPFSLLEGFPLVDAALPMRFALAGIPLIAILLVIALDRARVARNRVVPALVGLALLPLVPAPLPTADRPSVPRFYADGYWRECAGPGEVIVTVPLPAPPDPEPMRYAAWARTAFALPEGFFMGPYGRDGGAALGRPKRRTSALLSRVAETGIVPKVDYRMRSAALADVTAWRAKCLVLTAHPRHEELRRTMDLLYGPSERVADAFVWRPRQRLRRSFSGAIELRRRRGSP